MTLGVVIPPQKGNTLSEEHDVFGRATQENQPNTENSQKTREPAQYDQPRGEARL